MSVSILIQTEGESLGGKRRQTLVVPTDSGAAVYSRTTDGSKAASPCSPRSH